MFYLLLVSGRECRVFSMFFYKDKLLSPGQLKRLSEHRYSYVDGSILDPFLQPWWNWLVNKIPLWLAPNLITIVGLIVNIVTTLILIWYSPDAKAEVRLCSVRTCPTSCFHQVL